MCGRFTYKLTWPEIAKLYRLSLDAPARNTQPRYNICPTTQIDTVLGREGARALVPCAGVSFRSSPPHFPRSLVAVGVFGQGVRFRFRRHLTAQAAIAA
jgi:hypothetical protein